MHAAFRTTVIAIAMLAGLTAFAEVDVTPLSDGSILQAIFAFITNVKGAPLLGIVAGLVEVGVVVFRTSIGKTLAGKYTLAVLYALTAVAFVLHGIVSGTAITQIITNTVFTGALLNSANEIFKHLFEAKV